MNNLPVPGLYVHFRNGKLYRLLFLARRSEEIDHLDAIYIPLYDTRDLEHQLAPAQVMSRPAEMFAGIVEYGPNDPGRAMFATGDDLVFFGPRFIRVGD